MKALLVAMLAAGWCMIPGAVAADDGQVAIVKTVSGQIDVVRGESRQPATVGMPLLQSDRLVTGSDATGGITFRDGSRITLGPSSDLEISSYAFEPEKSSYDFTLRLQQGTAVYSSGKIGKLAPESVNMNTPRAVVGIRGTRFIVEVN